MIDIKSYIDKADKYAAIKAYEHIDSLRHSKELIIKNKDIKFTLSLIDTNRIGFESNISINKEYPQVNLDEIKHTFNIRSNDNHNSFESMFLESFDTTFDEFKESNDRNVNKFEMLKLFNKYLNLRIDNSVSKTLLPIYENITSEDDIESLSVADTRATVLVAEPRPMDKLSQVEHIGNRLCDMFFSDEDIGTAKKVIGDALSDPQISNNDTLHRLLSNVIRKYSVDYETFLGNNNLTLKSMYDKVGITLRAKLKSDDTESSDLMSLVSDIIIILECIFILSNDRYNVL